MGILGKKRKKGRRAIKAVEWVYYSGRGSALRRSGERIMVVGCALHGGRVDFVEGKNAASQTRLHPPLRWSSGFIFCVSKKVLVIKQSIERSISPMRWSREVLAQALKIAYKMQY